MMKRTPKPFSLDRHTSSRAVQPSWKLHWNGGHGLPDWLVLMGVQQYCCNGDVSLMQGTRLRCLNFCNIFSLLPPLEELVGVDLAVVGVIVLTRFRWKFSAILALSDVRVSGGGPEGVWRGGLRGVGIGGGGRRHLHVVTDLSAVVVDGVEVVLVFAESKVSESEGTVFSFRKGDHRGRDARERGHLICWVVLFFVFFVVLIVVFCVVARMHVWCGMFSGAVMVSGILSLNDDSNTSAQCNYVFIVTF